MITIIFERNRECIADEVFPSIHVDVAFEEEDDATTILGGMVSLLRYAGYRITKKSWEEAGEDIAAMCHFDEEVLNESEMALIKQIRKEEQDEEK